MSPLALLAVAADEAPSSISGSDQVRAAVVLGFCLLAMGVLALLAVRQARRRRRTMPSGQDQGRSGQDQGRSGQAQGGQGPLKPDQNGSASHPPGR